MGYILDHWRGNHSLALSVWVNAVGLTVLWVMLDKAISDLAPGLALSNDGQIVLISSQLAFVVMLRVWQIVGVWRSAKKHVELGGMEIWTRVTQVFAVIWLVELINSMSVTIDAIGALAANS